MESIVNTYVIIKYNEFLGMWKYAFQGLYTKAVAEGKVLSFQNDLTNDKKERDTIQALSVSEVINAQLLF